MQKLVLASLRSVGATNCSTFLRLIIVGSFVISCQLALTVGGFAGEFKVEVKRNKGSEIRKGERGGKPVEGERVTGELYVNGTKIGETFENKEKMIPTGTYDGLLRVTSDKGHVLNDIGVLGDKGDFLLEIKVGGRSDILFHGGNEPWHSEGCIMLGAVVKDKEEKRKAPNTLIELRKTYMEAKSKDNKVEIRVVVSQQ